ncbi:hypothetical protein FA15DRAFT_673469 [Coprinopsis marcescibilis]|uniref:Microbial-type PARG catalytic domain-containing protein n=1 Tax=Coprinopsis marcescibilis TaxID=230819 RepID=A0A5C3KJR2_COPMA|nr:hypothetical protein FA15DRAFT_673469 [Coprinopsis marcescibilis]
MDKSSLIGAAVGGLFAAGALVTASLSSLSPGPKESKHAYTDRTPARQSYSSRREQLKHVADRALETIKRGRYPYHDKTIDLDDALKEMCHQTSVYWEDNLELQNWKERQGQPSSEVASATVSVLNISTLDAARLLHNSFRFAFAPGVAPVIGVLNFASATKPGGGFKNGAEAQEESIARVSTLSCSLNVKEARKFYELHNKEKRREVEGASFYTHTMIYSPSVVVFLNDEASYVDAYKIDVVSCAAVNAKEIVNPKANSAQTAGMRAEIDKVMFERMGRILRLLEIRGIRNIILGTFGTGVFKNEIATIARHWANLLTAEDARFKYSFDRVIFAVLGSDNFGEFHNAFEGYSRPSRKGKESPKKGGMLRIGSTSRK